VPAAAEVAADQAGGEHAGVSPVAVPASIQDHDFASGRSPARMVGSGQIPMAANSPA
jgi:hypothetical protein